MVPSGERRNEGVDRSSFLDEKKSKPPPKKKSSLPERE